MKNMIGAAKMTRAENAREAGSFQEPRSDEIIRKLLLELENVNRENAELKERNRSLKENLRTDPLTGIYNRLYMQKSLLEEMERSERYGNCFSILMLDIDFFKRINDSYGHLAGDRILKKLASLLKHNLRNCDRLFRYGGEEFLVILPETTLSGAYTSACKIRKTIETACFECITENITLSIGVSQYRQDTKVSELIQQADDALYEAKEKGRNQVRLATVRTRDMAKTDRDVFYI